MRRTVFLLQLMLPVFVLGFAGGCTHQQAMNRAVDSWKGQQAAEVIAAWGKPTEELKLEGKQLLLWNSYDGKLAAPGEKRPASGPVVKECVRLLEVDRSGRVVKGTWDGNDCPGWFSGWAR